MYIFHGGCQGCTRQKKEPEGVDFCAGCKYFQADWKLPNLNNKDPDQAEMKRQEIKDRLGI